METIKDRVKSLARLRDISIPDLEKKCEFGNGTIGKWDTSTPSALKLHAVARELNTTIEYLLTGKNSEQNLLAAIFGEEEKERHEQETKEKLAAILGKSVDEVFGQKENLIHEHRDEVENIIYDMMSDFTPQQFDVLIQLNSRERDQAVAFAQGLIASRKD